MQNSDSILSMMNSFSSSNIISLLALLVVENKCSLILTQGEQRQLTIGIMAGCDVSAGERLAKEKHPHNLTTPLSGLSSSRATG